MREEIENVRNELNTVLDSEAPSSEKVVALSEKLDRLILQYYRNVLSGGLTHNIHLKHQLSSVFVPVLLSLLFVLREIVF